MKSNWENYVSYPGRGQVMLDYGPATMTVLAVRNGYDMGPVIGSHLFRIVDEALKELAVELPVLKSTKRKIGMQIGDVGSRMRQAVRLTEDRTLTPMAAVAGAVADYTADSLLEIFPEIDKLSVNNGGDIAIRLKNHQKIRMSLPMEMGAWMDIYPDMNIGGAATSGLGGRSMTLGIAEAVTVFAESASIADAYATHLANATRIDSEHVMWTYAENLDKDTDIPGYRVVTGVDGLSGAEIRESEQKLRNAVMPAIQTGKIYAAAAVIGGRTFTYGIRAKEKVS